MSILKSPLYEKAVTLIIIGLDDAGKTTMVASLKGEPPDGITPTIGFANAEFTLSRCKVTVYDLGGGVRIRDVWKNYYAEVYGVVFVLDSCNVKRLDETKEVFQQVLESSKILGKPFLIFANKQDKVGALTAEDITNALDLQNSKHSFSYKVFTCSALKGYGRGTDKNINAGFQWLLNTISNEFGKISSRVEHDVAIQKEEEEKERKARLERIRKIREERDRQEREAGNDPDKEDSDDDVMMVNPFQPIGKHLENMKSKERKKKLEKEKKQKAEQTRLEMEAKEDNEQPESSNVKKKKKKKKKAVKVQEEEDMQVDVNNDAHAASTVDADDHHHEIPQHSYDEDNGVVVKKKKKKKKIAKHLEDESAHCDNTDGIKNSCFDEKDERMEEDVHNSHDEDNNTLVKKKKKKQRIKVVEEIDRVPSGEEESFNPSPVIKKQKKKKKTLTNFDEDIVERKFEIESEMKFQNGNLKEIEDIDSHTLENGESVEASESISKVKKPKTKKRKKKKNRTAPVDHVPEDEAASLPAPVWKTPPSNWTSLPPIGNNGDSTNIGGLPPLRSNKTKKTIGDSTMQQLPSSSPSWARTRPNSEDYDLVT
eukprot:gene17358-8946_t